MGNFFVHESIGLIVSSGSTHALRTSFNYFFTYTGNPKNNCWLKKGVRVCVCVGRVVDGAACCRLQPTVFEQFDPPPQLSQ